MFQKERSMATTSKKTASGHIVLVQETRFRLMTDSGQNYLLTLGHDANIAPRDLCHFLDADIHVVVEYTGQPGLVSGVAHTIRQA
jgi:hypothetical protein